MNAGTVLLILLFLACPLMMVLMMRGGHRGHGTGHAGCGHDGGHDHSRAHRREPSLDELRRPRDELDRLTEDAEATNGGTVRDSPTPAR